MVFLGWAPSQTFVSEYITIIVLIVIYLVVEIEVEQRGKFFDALSALSL